MSIYSSRNHSEALGRLGGEQLIIEDDCRSNICQGLGEVKVLYLIPKQRSTGFIILNTGANYVTERCLDVVGLFTIRLRS